MSIDDPQADKRHLGSIWNGHIHRVFMQISDKLANQPVSSGWPLLLSVVCMQAKKHRSRGKLRNMENLVKITIGKFNRIYCDFSLIKLHCRVISVRSIVGFGNGGKRAL